MTVLTTSVNPASDEFKANHAAGEALVADLRTQLERVVLGGGERARERHVGRGKLLPRERVDRLLDPGAPFLELSPMAAHGMYEDQAPGAGIITGIGRVSGRECVIVANDATVKGGTYYPLTVKKHLRAQEVALHNRLPCIYLVDSGGAFLPRQDEVFPDREHFGRIFFNQATMSAAEIPQIAAVMGSCTAGGAYVPAMSDETVIVRNQGTIFLGGPPLVKAATGEEVSAEELGGGELHSRTSGVTDHLADDDRHALAIVRRIVATLAPKPPLPWSRAAAEPPAVDPDTLLGVIPDGPAQALRRPRADRADRRRLAPAGVQGALRLDPGLRIRPHPRTPGRHPGQQRDPVLRSRTEGRALHRAVRPAADPAGVPAEHHRVHGRARLRGRRDRQARRQAGDRRLHRAGAEADGHRRRLVRRRQLRDGRPRVFTRLLWMWPGARISVMGGEQAATVMTEVGQQETGAELKEQYERQGHPYYATARLWDDGVIDPRDTRDVLGLALSAAGNAPLADIRYGVFRM